MGLLFTHLWQARNFPFFCSLCHFASMWWFHSIFWKIKMNFMAKLSASLNCSPLTSACGIIPDSIHEQCERRHIPGAIKRCEVSCEASCWAPFPLCWVTLTFGFLPWCQNWPYKWYHLSNLPCQLCPKMWAPSAGLPTRNQTFHYDSPKRSLWIICPNFRISHSSHSTRALGNGHSLHQTRSSRLKRSGRLPALMLKPQWCPFQAFWWAQLGLLFACSGQQEW